MACAVGKRLRAAHAVAGALAGVLYCCRTEPLGVLWITGPVALNSVAENKTWLAHSETSKLQVAVTDVDDHFRRSVRVFEVLEDILK